MHCTLEEDAYDVCLLDVQQHTNLTVLGTVCGMLMCDMNNDRSLHGSCLLFSAAKHAATAAAT